MIDMNMMQRKVELTYKELYELTYEWVTIDKYGNPNTWNKWVNSHPQYSEILLNLTKIDCIVQGLKYELNKNNPCNDNLIGYMGE